MPLATYLIHTLFILVDHTVSNLRCKLVLNFVDSDLSSRISGFHVTGFHFVGYSFFFAS